MDINLVKCSCIVHYTWVKFLNGEGAAVGSVNLKKLERLIDKPLNIVSRLTIVSREAKKKKPYATNE